MKKLIFLLALFALGSGFVSAQNIRFDGVVTSRGGLPAPGAQIAVCLQPATTVTTPCTPLAPLCASLVDGACSQPNPITADVNGNYFFYISTTSLPYTIQFYGAGLSTRNQPDQTGGGSGGGGGGGGATIKVNGVTQTVTNFNGVTPTVDVGFSPITFKTDTLNTIGEFPTFSFKVNSVAQTTTNLNGTTPAADSGFTAATAKSDGNNTILEVPTLAPSEFCLTGVGITSQLNIGFQGTTSPCSNPWAEILQQPGGGAGIFGPTTFFDGITMGTYLDLAAVTMYAEVSNCGSIGTSTSRLAKFNGTCAVITTTTDTSGILGVVGTTGGTLASAQIALDGHIPCFFDGGTTANDWVVPSITVGGDCHDTGTSASLPQPSGTQTVGITTSTNGSAGDYVIWITQGGGSGGGGGGGGTVTHATGALTAGLGIIGNSGGDIKSDPNFDDGVTTANTFTVKSTSGLAVSSGGAVSLVGFADSGSSCPSTVTSGTVAICSNSFAPEYIANNSGTPSVTLFDMASSNGIAGGIATLDGSAFVPAAQLPNFPAAWFIDSTNTTLSVTATGSIFTAADYGASPDATILGITDNATSATDLSTNFFTDTGAGSRHISFAARIQGTNQLQVVEQPGPEGQTIIGSAVTPPNLGASPFNKFWVISNTATHNVETIYQNSTSHSAVLLSLNDATAAGTGFFHLKACSGATGSNGQCGSGTTVASIRGDGLGTFTGLTGTAAIDFSGSTIFKVRVGAGLTTSANGDIGYDTTNKNWHVFQNGVDSFIAGIPVSSTVNNGDCVEFSKVSSVITLIDTGSACGAGGGGGAWSSLTNPISNLALSMGTQTSIFSGTAATNQFFAWKNTTAAIVGTSQGSPILSACGTAFHGSASVEDCTTLSELPGNGNDAAITANIGHTGSSTGAFILQSAGSVAAASDGTHAAEVSLLGNTTAPALTANSFSWLGPNSASFTGYAWQPPTAENASAGVLHIGAASSHISALTISGIAIADLTATGAASSTTFLRGDNTWATPAGSGTLTSIATASPITGGTITTTGTIGCSTCVTSAASLTSTALMTGGGLQASQTPSATSTLSSSGNMVLAGTVSATGHAGGFFSSAAAADSCVANQAVNSVCQEAPATVGTAYHRLFAGTPSTGIPHFAYSAPTITETISGIAIADLTATGSASSSTFLRGDNSWAVPPGGPCTVTALSLQYNNAGALGCVPDFTFSSPHTLTAGASGILDLHSSATSGLLLPGGLTTGIVTVTTSTGAISSTDFPDVKVYPAANCVSSTAGAAWNTTLTPACIAGSNNLGGELPFVDASVAQFETEIPADWDTTSQPFVNLFFNSGANTTGTVIFNVAVACTKSDGSVTSDPAFNTADALTTKTMAAASRTWSTTGQLTQVTSAHSCIPGATMLVKVTRATDTAGTLVQVTKLAMTTPRLITVQAN